MSTQKYFLNTFPLKYQRVLRSSSFSNYYLPPATDDALIATASALDLQIDFSYAPTKTAEKEIRTRL